MDRFYSRFWLDYCSGAIVLDPEFAERDSAYSEESEDFYNVRGRVVTTQTQSFVIDGHAVCDIEGKKV